MAALRRAFFADTGLSMTAWRKREPPPPAASSKKLGIVFPVLASIRQDRDQPPKTCLILLAAIWQMSIGSPNFDDFCQKAGCKTAFCILQPKFR